MLESIDRLNHKRKQEREKEKIIRAARSRSKPEDPELAAKIKEQAKQVCPVWDHHSMSCTEHVAISSGML